MRHLRYYSGLPGTAAKSISSAQARVAGPLLFASKNVQNKYFRYKNADNISEQLPDMRGIERNYTSDSGRGDSENFIVRKRPLVMKYL